MEFWCLFNSVCADFVYCAITHWLPKWTCVIQYWEFNIVLSLLANSTNSHSTSQETPSISNSTSIKCDAYSRVSSFHIFLKFRPDNGTQYGGNLTCDQNRLRHSLTRITLILLISCHIQLNPGPKTTKAPKYPCGICHKNVNSNQKAMECENCLTWFHTKCIGMSKLNHQVHMQHSSYVWLCCGCGLPNFTDSSLFVSFHTSNPFDSLNDIDSDSNLNSSHTSVSSNFCSGNLSNPLHTSSPKKQGNVKKKPFRQK